MKTIEIFPDFLHEPRQYEQAAALWLRRWQDLAQYTRQSHLWKSQWLTTTFCDGTPCQDGNPIFSAVAASRKLGIRVIQHEIGDQQRPLTFWTNTHAKGEPEEIQELVIACCLTEYTLSMALDIMQQWMTKGAVRLSHEWPYEPAFAIVESTLEPALARVA
jgi:hypothetical protein